MSDDGWDETRVLNALRERLDWHADDIAKELAAPVLAAIRAAADEASRLVDEPVVYEREVLDAALAALTDHPGGTDNG